MATTDVSVPVVADAVVTQNPNTAMYSTLKTRLSQNRTDIKQSSDRIVDVQSSINSISSNIVQLQAQMQTILDRVSNLESADVPDCTDLVNQAIQDYSSNQLEPILNTLVDDLENITIDVKTLKSGQGNQATPPQQDVYDAMSVVSQKASKAQPAVKPLNIVRKSSRF